MTNEIIDLTNCDREPIHIPSLIQPHGVLLVLKDPTLEILQVSSNTQEVVGRQPDELLGKPLSDLLNVKQIKRIKQDDNLKMIPVVVFTTSNNPKDIRVVGK